MIQTYIFVSLIALLGCGAQTNKLDGEWQLNKESTFAVYASNRGAFEILPPTDPAWPLMKQACFVIANGNKLHLVTRDGDHVSPIRINEVEPKVWTVSVDSSDYPFSIKVAVVDETLRVLDAGHIFVLEKTCQRE
ncbi:MAG: hypothetical protein ACPGQS_08475 [Bradymonadia bacterium]